MNYNIFKNRFYCDSSSKVLSSLKQICRCFFFTVFVSLMPITLILTTNKEIILWVFLLLSSPFFAITMIVIFVGIPFILDDKRLIKETEDIRKKLLMDELPVDVDLADYFKQREIDLLEAETKGNIDLMKKQYLRGE